MASKGLTEAWRSAEAAMPPGWEIRGVVRGPREAEPLIRGVAWVAWAVGPNDERLSGNGDSPREALMTLTVQLRRVGE